jgi:hypothetical protein
MDSLAEPLPEEEAQSSAAPVQISVSSEDMKAFQAFLAERVEKAEITKSDA